MKKIIIFSRLYDLTICELELIQNGILQLC